MADHTKEAMFWDKWADFRVHKPDGQPVHFWHLVDTTPLLDDLHQFISVQNGTLAISLMSGSTYPDIIMLRGNEQAITGFVAIDGNGNVEADVLEYLTAHGIQNPRFFHRDLAGGLPVQNIQQLIDEIRPAQLHFWSIYGITYLPDMTLKRLIAECMDLGERNNLPTILDIAMLTGERFDPDVLGRKFTLSVIPRLLLAGEFRRLGKALKSLPPTIQFGKEIRQALEIRPASEILDLLAEWDYVIPQKHIDTSILWGQTTVIRISKQG